MPKQQKTFDLVPVGPVYDGPRRAMTSKQAKREYKKKNKVPTISWAEERRLEKEELDQQKRDADRERAASKAKWVREKKAAKVLAEKNERKRLGLPEPSREVRAGQPLISMFVNKGVKRTNDDLGTAEDADREFKKARLELEELSESDFLELTNSELAESFGADKPLVSINKGAKRTSDELEAFGEEIPEFKKARLELEDLSEQDLLELTTSELAGSFGPNKPLISSIDKGVKRGCDELEDSEKADREFKKARLELKSLSEQDFLDLTNSDLAESFETDELLTSDDKKVKRTSDELEDSDEADREIKKARLELESLSEQDFLELTNLELAGSFGADELPTSIDGETKQSSENNDDTKETGTKTTPSQRVFKKLHSPRKQVPSGQPPTSTSPTEEAKETSELAENVAETSTDSKRPQTVLEDLQRSSRPVMSAQPPVSKGKNTNTKTSTKKVEKLDSKAKKPREAFKNALQPTKLVKAGQSLLSPFLPKGAKQTAEAPAAPEETDPSSKEQRRVLGELDPNSLRPIAG